MAGQETLKFLIPLTASVLQENVSQLIMSVSFIMFQLSVLQNLQTLTVVDNKYYSIIVSSREIIFFSLAPVQKLQGLLLYWIVFLKATDGYNRINAGQLGYW